MEFEILCNKYVKLIVPSIFKAHAFSHCTHVLISCRIKLTYSSILEPSRVFNCNLEQTHFTFSVSLNDLKFFPNYSTNIVKEVVAIWLRFLTVMSQILISRLVQPSDGLQK